MLTELLERELIISIKIYLALNNLQKLICHKTQTITTSTSYFQGSFGTVSSAPTIIYFAVIVMCSWL